MIPTSKDQETLEQYIDKPLTKRKIATFDGILVREHVGFTHPIYKIPAYFSIMDALCYIFNNDVIPIADVLQAKVDNVPHALSLLEALEEGIRSKTICLTCIKKSMMHNN
ncbi:MAG: hypothetical protein H8D23_17615 [Candidatus Brocadiales bacterium]|nr:hypothetical protein [Candidatus Brocadiales bacterium]